MECLRRANVWSIQGNSTCWEVGLVFWEWAESWNQPWTVMPMRGKVSLSTQQGGFQPPSCSCPGRELRVIWGVGWSVGSCRDVAHASIYWGGGSFGGMAMASSYGGSRTWKRWTLSVSRPEVWDRYIWTYYKYQSKDKAVGAHSFTAADHQRAIKVVRPEFKVVLMFICS